MGLTLIFLDPWEALVSRLDTTHFSEQYTEASGDITSYPQLN